MSNNVILGLFAETSIHAGAGASLDVIDLPIQREAHTGFPCVFGSAIKGAMRSKAETLSGENKVDIKMLFGPDSTSQSKDSANEHSGSVNISDAKLLLLPVASLTGYFKWVTCPALLQRLDRDCKRLGLKGLTALPTEFNNIGDNDCYTDDQNSQNIFLNEYSYQSKHSKIFEKICPEIQAIIGSAYLPQDDLRKRIVVVSNTQFSHLARFAPPVAPHIAIDSDTKMVKSGALWFEETLSPETVLYTCINANHSRKDKGTTTAEQVLADFKKLFSHEYLQIGGNETVGMGWVHVGIYDQKA